MALSFLRWRKNLVLIATLFACAPLARADLSSENAGAETGIICRQVNLPAFQTHGQDTRTLFNKYGETLRAIEAYRQKCLPWMKDPGQTDAAAQLTAERGKAMGKIEEFKMAVSAWKQRNTKFTSAVQALMNRSCLSNLKYVDQYYSSSADTEFAKQMRAACTADAQNNPTAGVSRGRELGNDIAGNDAARATKVEETINNPRHPRNRQHSAELLTQAAEAADKLGLESPRVGANDRTCGESCAAVLRAQAACANGANYTIACSNAIEAARNTRKGLYGTVYR